MRDFRKYDVWQLAHGLVLEIYNVTKTFPREESFGLTGQIRRAVLSIPTNICEGVGEILMRILEDFFKSHRALLMRLNILFNCQKN
jgi:four helix bundle protein